MPELTEQERREQLERLEAIGADVKRFRAEHPDSQLAGAAFQLAGLVGKLQAAVASAPTTAPRDPSRPDIREAPPAFQAPAEPDTRDFDRAREEVDEQLRDAAALERGDANG